MLWRYEVGEIVVHGIRDGGSTRDPLKYLIGSTPETLAPYAEYFNSDGSMPNSFSCYLIETSGALVMVDTGFGVSAPDGMDVGHMPHALERLGVAPGDVDHVVFTHLHPDHILGSLTADDQPFFANARHWTLRRELEHWRSETGERAMGIAGMANTLDSAGVLDAPEEPGAIVEGIDTAATYGHTPGHVAVRVSSGHEALVIAGDATFSPVQVWHPEWSFPLDVDAEAAATTRERFFAELAARGDAFVAGHYAQPGIGRVIETVDGLDYEPIAAQEVLSP